MLYVIKRLAIIVAATAFLIVFGERQSGAQDLRDMVQLKATLAGGEAMTEILPPHVCREVVDAIAAGAFVEGLASDGTVHRIISARCVAPGTVV